MTESDTKAVLAQYLRTGRDALLWKLDGLGEYDIRRPLTPTGTNLLGLIKHVASVAAGYFGDVFERPFPQEFPWFADGAAPNADMWAGPDESREAIVDLHHRAWAHVDATIDALPLDAPGRVPWWPEVRRDTTLATIMVHMLAELGRHAGHADIVRELIDGTVGLRDGNDNMGPVDSWDAYRSRLETTAATFA